MLGIVSYNAARRNNHTDDMRNLQGNMEKI